jgi:hypothetical protein
MQLLGACHDMVGRHGQQHGIGFCHQGGQGQSGGRIAAHGLQHQLGAGNALLLQLLGCQKTVFCVADEDGASLLDAGIEPTEARCGVLQHRFAIGAQAQELLGIVFAR